MQEMNSFYEDLASFGFSSLTYGNYWEYGLDVGDPERNLATVCDPSNPQRWSNGPRVVKPKDFAPRVRDMCDSNLFLQNHMPNAPWRQWNNDGVIQKSVYPAGMMGAAAMDAGDPDYKAHLVKMAGLLAAKLPASAGVCFDGTGWGSYVNIQADDGRTYIELWPSSSSSNSSNSSSINNSGNISSITTPIGTARDKDEPLIRGRVARSQVSSMLIITKALGEALHSNGKFQVHNSYSPRLDFWEHTDAVFSENGFRDDLMHHNSLLGIGGKPVIAWQPGCGRDPTFVQCPPREEWDWPVYADMTPANAQAAQRRLLMRLLFWGNQPAVPFPRNDHTITPWIATKQGLLPIFKGWAPLFQQIRGRQWVLAPHAVNVTGGPAQVNLFRVGPANNSTRYVAPVVFAPHFSTINVSLRGIDLPCVGSSSGSAAAAVGGVGRAMLVTTAMQPLDDTLAKVDCHASVVGQGAVDVSLRFGPAGAVPSPAGRDNATSVAVVVFTCA
jgi:hypothetical protein